MRTLNEFKLEGKKVLLRCDFNIPLKDGKILDDFRIRATIPTIKYLIEKGAKVILMSHLGRPSEIKNKKLRIKNFSLKPVAERLEKLLKIKIKFLPDCIGEEVEKEIEVMKPREIVLLENLRFHKEEEENAEKFAQELANLGDIFLNDAFAASHRAHASIVGIPKYIPSGSGLLFEEEIKNLKKVIEGPRLPLVAIFGGREADFKVVDRLSAIAKFILIGYLIKKEIEKKKIILKYPEKTFFPVDGINKKGENYDIGPKTIKLFKEKILKAKTIFWSGPLGKIEEKEFQKGTKEIAKAIIKSQAFSVIGGGETIEFINEIGFSKKFSHLSTGGSAMLAFLAGEKLPGIAALEKSEPPAEGEARPWRRSVKLSGKP
jgi:phosphoglycerate kinase